MKMRAAAMLAALITIQSHADCVSETSQVTKYTNMDVSTLCQNQNLEGAIAQIHRADAACGVQPDPEVDKYYRTLCSAGYGDGSSKIHATNGDATDASNTNHDENNSEFMSAMSGCNKIPSENDKNNCISIALKKYKSQGGRLAQNGRNGSSSGSDPGLKKTGSGTEPPTDEPLDPEANYDGKPCCYFTRKCFDDSHTYTYSAGSVITYGKWTYECESSGRWKNRGSADAIQGASALKIEKSNANTNIFQKD